jgi:organic radical activating enzyme
MKDPKTSYTAADSFPVKLFQNPELIRQIVTEGFIPPTHVQLIPTNRCNLTCAFCSCAEEDRSLEMSEEQLHETISVLAPWITSSATITGGGEPLLYPHFDTMIWMLVQRAIKLGLVTNGTLLHKQTPARINQLTWCRISHGDEREEICPRYLEGLAHMVKKCPEVDWAFSYVVGPWPKVEQIRDLVLFANLHKFTHVRLVADLLQPDDVPMDWLRGELDGLLQYVDVPVIFQARKKPEKGKDCRICYLKPVLAPDMKIYACCGAQYALKTSSLKFPQELCLGEIKDLPDIIKRQSLEPFEGAEHCVKCYYGDYNRALSMLLSNTEHREFV